MKIRVTLLCENSVGPMSGTLGEHGFAALVEHAGGALLFDTGQGATLMGNAQRMNKDLTRVTKVALSHGHYDHTGGLMPLVTSCGHKDVYAHPEVFLQRYRVKDTGESIAIGIPHSEENLRRAGADFHFSTEFRELETGLFLTGEVPRARPFEVGDFGLYCDETGCQVDRVLDDQSLIITTERGLVLVLGCCHAGIINTMDLAVARTGIEEIYAVVGGTHLGFCAGYQLEETIKALRNYRIRKLCASHCTGFSASARLFMEFPGQFHPAHVGYTLEI